MSNNEAGFTLIEVLIAMVIMGISFSVLIQGFMVVNEGIENSRTYNYVSDWTKSKLNEYISKAETNNVPAMNGRFEYLNQIYNWRVNNNYIASNENIRKVRVVVEWQGKNGIKKYSLSQVVIEER